MTKTLIGIDYTGTACIKITKGTYNPVTTPDTEREKFYYSSKWAADVKVNAVVSKAFNSAAGPTYTPTGTGWELFHVTRTTGWNYSWEIFKNTYFNGIVYSFPLYDIKYTDPSNDHYTSLKTVRYLYGYEDRGGVWAIENWREAGWLASGAVYRFSLGTWAGNVTANATSVAVLDTSESTSSLIEKRKPYLVTWRLPGDNTAIQNGTALSPVSGQQSIRLSSTELKVAKPGFNVNTSTGTQLAFSAADNPANIVAAANISIPAGASFYETGVTLPASTVIDLHFYPATGSVVYPCLPQMSNVEFGADYWIDGTKIRFYNGNAACRARFIVISYDNTGTSSGTNSVLRQFADGAENVVQFLRPGANATPKFGDIALDSRWPSIQIIDEGYFSVAVGNDVTNTITYDATGMFTFVKYMTVHGAADYEFSGELGLDYTKCIRPPTVASTALYNVGWKDWTVSGRTSYVVYSSTQAVFHTFRGNPIKQTYDAGSDVANDTPRLDYDPSPIIGIRYYIFGIATA